MIRHPGLRRAAFASLALLCTTLAAKADDVKLKLKKNDHIAIIGNTLADRMQHDGWMEAFLIDRFPDLDLSIRNMGFSGDELTIRLRSANFGSPDEWLKRTEADVVLAFFGYNESHAGKEGLPKFKAELEQFIKHTRSQKYNGKTAPQLVLLSPIAQEEAKGRDLPDPSAGNERIRLYTEAMAEVAKAGNIPFVDLYTPSSGFYRMGTLPGGVTHYTINGIHLNDRGNLNLARVIAFDLFPRTPDMPDIAKLEKIRKAVLDKNFYWFNRYRTVDGYSIYGGRADLAFVGGQTNRVVAQREMEILDVMTANRDKKIWAVAQGKEYTVDDSNTPDFIPVVTNKPGAGPNGTHVFLDPDKESIAQMTVGKGLKINLFASEKEYPDLVKPVQMAFDPRGRLWVATWASYPHWKPKDKLDDRILILEDTDGDGKADKRTVFADGLHCPTGFEFINGGVVVAQQPDVMFLKDTDGDDKADIRERILSGIDSADTHHAANSFQLDPGGALYFQEGTFHHSQIETPYGPPVRLANAGIFRYEPKSQKIDVYVTFGFANPHGHAFDRWGQDIVVDGTGSNPYHGTLFSGHLDYPNKHGRPPQVYQQRTRPCPGVEYLTSKQFPEEFQNNLLVGNVIGFQGILRYKVEDKDSTLAATELEPIVSSRDPNFRPSDIEMGPDGAIYFTEWQNPIIGHMQHNLRDPSRDRVHGRVYRVIYEGRPLDKPVAIAGQPIDALLDLLKQPEDRVRYRAKVELGSRPAKDVIAATEKWVEKLDKSDSEYEHNLLEALWVHQSQDVVNAALLDRVLKSPDFRARAAGTRVLCYWRDRVPNALELLKTLAADSYPRVRLEAVRAASFFTVPEAIEIPLISAEQPSDEGLDYTRGETLKALEPYWRKAVAEGKAIQVTSDAGARYLLQQVKTDELLKMSRTRAVDLELMLRPGVREEARRESLADLARREKKDEVHVLLDALRVLDESKGARDESVAFDLTRLIASRPATELASIRGDLEKMATSAHQAISREIGFLGLIAADGNADRAWDVAAKSVNSLRDLLNAMPVIRDPAAREGLYSKVEPLLAGLPASLSSSKDAKGLVGRYIRIDLRGRKTLTLAEVEVLSDGRNVAPSGKATQKNTGFGGPASKAIDGVKSSIYGMGGQTHTEEDTQDPWWELDLKSEYPIDSIAIYNRQDGDLYKRLEGYTLRVLDGHRQNTFTKARQPAPNPKVVFDLGGAGSEGIIRRAAMNALTYVRGKEGQTFKAVAKYAKQDADRGAAIRALLRIPASYWPQEEVLPLLESLTAYVRTLPTEDRTSATALDALQLADGLASTLKPDEAGKFRRELGDLGVRIIRLGTVPDQMLYDKERLAAKAGKPVEIILENNDIMPHNVVVTMPGALQEVGELAESTATQPGALERNYVPQTPKILMASRLLAPRESQKISFTAPTKPGVYPYVCTYPGHWRRMYGAFYVVEDLDAYLSDPEGYLAAHPLPISDELLKFNRPRKEWKYDDLASSVEALEGRSFANGKQIFRVASCVSCHRLNGEGVVFGPDLTKLEPPMKATEILKHVLEPSLKIDDKYLVWNIAHKDGKVVTGMILEETPEAVKLIENPLAKAEPETIKKADIDERAKSPVSLMPKGLLDKLTRDEILDLIAYVSTGGDAKGKVFGAGGHDHDHGAVAPAHDHHAQGPGIVYKGGEGPGKGKHVVLVGGDEEYRSEEALPQLGKILARRHGFTCTVLLPIDKDGAIDPNRSDIPGLEALRNADLMILFTRFRDLPEDQMKEIIDYAESGRPVIGMRTATHAFNIKGGKPYSKYSWSSKDFNGGFGKQVLGETWVSHHGNHGKQSTRGILAQGMKDHPILKGIKDGDIWGPTDVYEAHPSGDSKALVLGQVVEDMEPTGKPLAGKKNDPMMPVAWIKTYTGTSGKPARVFNTTMGAATDLQSEGLRRLLVNATYWAVGLEDKISPAGDVEIVGEYKPTKFGFGGFVKGVRPEAHAEH